MPPIGSAAKGVGRDAQSVGAPAEPVNGASGGGRLDSSSEARSKPTGATDWFTTLTRLPTGRRMASERRGCLFFHLSYSILEKDSHET